MMNDSPNASDSGPGARPRGSWYVYSEWGSPCRNSSNHCRTASVSRSDPASMSSSTGRPSKYPSKGSRV